jgi:hypothetical protein
LDAVPGGEQVHFHRDPNATTANTSPANTTINQAMSCILIIGP